MVSIGGVLGGAFRLFREQPIALLIWWVIAVAFAVASTLLFDGLQANPYGAGAGVGGGFIAKLIGYYVVAIVFAVVQSSAAFRAVMRPSESMAGFLRVGLDELLVFAMGALWVIAFIIFYFVLIAFGIAVARLLIQAGGYALGWGMIPLMLILMSPVYGLIIWLHVRLSPALPLTILRRSFVIGEAWRATRGQFWRLFAAYAVLGLLIVVVYLALIMLLMGGYWAALIRGEPPAVAAMTVRGFGPLTIIGWFVSGAANVFVYALWAGSVGTATQQLVHDEGQDYAETFA